MKYKYVFGFYVGCIILCCCSRPEPIKYFVQPCEFVCNYSFNDTSKWAITCRVWGLLKYYHPNITAGKHDWDNVLLDRLVSINYSSTSQMVNAELKDMVDAAGGYTLKTDVEWNDSLNMNLDLCWLDNSFLDDTLKNELKRIASLKVEYPAYYRIDFGNVMLPNEKTYNSDVNNYKYRLLALFRYWNVIYYFSPHKYLMDKSWDKTLNDFIFPFINSADRQSYQLSFIKLAASLNDGHAYISFAKYYSAEYQDIIERIGEKTVVKIDAGGLEKGDIVDCIGKLNIDDIRDSLSAQISASTQGNKEYRINCYVAEMIFSQETEVTILRNNQKLKVNMLPVIFEKKNTELCKWVSEDIAYVDFSALKKDSIEQMFHTLFDAKGIIFDLRKGVDESYDPDIFACYLSENKSTRLFPSVFPDPAHPGAFFWYEDNQAFSKNTTKCPRYNGKIVYLINEDTQSALETIAWVGRTNYHAILIGRPTSGALGRVTWIPLPGNHRTAFSNFALFSLDKTELQRRGITPDIEVYPTVESIKAGKDEILETAIEFFNNQ